MGLCVFDLPISFVMIERIYILCLIIIIKSEVWTIAYCLGLGNETMVCAVCLSIFLLSANYFCLFYIDGLIKIKQSLYRPNLSLIASLKYLLIGSSEIDCNCLAIKNVSTVVGSHSYKHLHGISQFIATVLPIRINQKWHKGYLRYLEPIFLKQHKLRIWNEN